MNKLNFGCGDKIADGWVNIDFESSDPSVKQVNLLSGFPFPDNHFDAVYSSHVLEHFTPEQALFLLKEAYRVLKPKGIVRIVVPNLEAMCKEYLRILALPDDEKLKNERYQWVTIELLDQLVRSFPGGEMGKFFEKVQAIDNDDDQKLMYNYIQERVGIFQSSDSVVKSSLLEKLRKLTVSKIYTKLLRIYIKLVTKLIPKNIRNMVFVETAIGERHRWMYDVYGLSTLFEKAGFVNISSLAYNESAIADFQSNNLDSNADNSIYKPNSIFLEASK